MGRLRPFLELNMKNEMTRIIAMMINRRNKLPIHISAKGAAIKTHQLILMGFIPFSLLIK